jgi:hypothetical protein
MARDETKHPGTFCPMPIRSKLTVREPAPQDRDRKAGGQAKREPSEEERATRRARVAAAKDALARSAGLRGDHVGAARAALKAYLRHLNDGRQPSDDQFQALIEAPFKAPPKPRRSAPGR